jgi:integrase
MKSLRDHRVPLSGAAIDLLNRMKGQDSDFVFPGAKRSKPLSNMALLVLLKLNVDPESRAVRLSWHKEGVAIDGNLSNSQSLSTAK